MKLSYLDLMTTDPSYNLSMEQCRKVSEYDR